MAIPRNQYLDDNNPAFNNPPATNNAPTNQPTQWGYDRKEAVSFDVWQTEMAFDRLDGQPRNTAARNTPDAQYWYDNYVNQWNSGDAVKRHALDQQHGFFGGNLLDQTPAIPETNEAPPAQMSPPTPPPPQPTPALDPQPEDISPEPEEEDTNIGSDLTPEDNSTTVDTEKDTERSQDEDTNVDDDSLLTVRDVTPEDEVVDPITGTRYSTPEAARRAGITNWVWASDYTG